jgi:hypothetical protein
VLTLLWATLALAQTPARIEASLEVPVVHTSSLRGFDGGLAPFDTYFDRITPLDGGVLVEASLPGRKAEWLVSTSARGEAINPGSDFSASSWRTAVDVGVRSRVPDATVAASVSSGLGVEIAHVVQSFVPAATRAVPHAFLATSTYFGTGQTRGLVGFRVDAGLYTGTQETRIVAASTYLGTTYHPGHVTVSVHPGLSFSRPTTLVLGPVEREPALGNAGLSWLAATGLAAAGGGIAFAAQDNAMLVLAPVGVCAGAAGGARLAAPGTRFGWSLLGAFAGTVVSAPVAFAVAQEGSTTGVALGVASVPMLAAGGAVLGGHLDAKKRIKRKILPLSR